jgi:outer membrane lipoprotein-sorting protein
MFFDSMILKGVGKDELVSVTSDTRILNNTAVQKQHNVVVEPDYDVTTYRTNPGSNELIALRVIHISRRTMKPFQLDVYDDKGEIETQALYDNYTKFGDLTFPSRITIKRPQQQLTLVLDILTLQANQQMDDDQFKLEIPPGIKVEKLP